MRELAGWGNYPISSSYVSRPEQSQKLTLSSDKTLARGLGRSYGDAALNSNSQVILTERLHRFLEFDPISGILKAEAGASIEEILSVFVPRDFDIE